MIRYLIWDVDGTLLDTYPVIVQAMMTALGQLGRWKPQQAVDALCKVSLSHCVDVLARELDLEAEQLARAFRSAVSAAPLAAQRPFPGVIELCRWAIGAGGANFILTHRDRSELDALLEAHGLAALFRDCVAGDDGFPRKPDPAGVLDLCARNAVNTDEALVVGDREIDILAAHRAGIRACLFGANPCLEPPDYSVAHFGELLGILTARASAVEPEMGHAKDR